MHIQADYLEKEIPDLATLEIDKMAEEVANAISLGGTPTMDSKLTLEGRASLRTRGSSTTSTGSVESTEEAPQELGEAIAEMLASSECRIKTLSQKWNQSKHL